ncbi:MAG: hypothetical protein ACYC21_08060 [Eubacteriales bacterium]
MKVNNPFKKLTRIYQLALTASIINILVLLYATWIKYNTEACPSCNQLILVPVSGVFVAVAGLVTTVILTAAIYLSSRGKLYRFAALVIAGISSTVASYLQVVQFLWAKKLCYPCLTAATLFYLTFCLLMCDYLKSKPFIFRQTEPLEQITIGE